MTDIISNLLMSGFYRGTASTVSVSFEDAPPMTSFERHMESLFDQFTGLITSKKNLVDKGKLRLQAQRAKFETEQKSEWDKLSTEKSQWEESKARAQTLYTPEDSIIEINIGGTHFITTTKATLMKHPDSALSAMFSGRHPISRHKGKAFVDRDGQAFVQMVSFLRNSKIPYFQSLEEEVNFFAELDFWGVPADPQEPDTPKQFDPNWCAPSLTLLKNNTELVKSGTVHGIAFGACPLTKRSPYVEFRIRIAVPSSGGSHVFVGVVDKSKYSSTQLVSTLWRDAPSSWYWDIWSMKLIRTDEQGVHTVVTNYGCDCEDDETIIGIYYDAKKQTLSFYKQGICQGVAFSNVSSGLHPSIDVWFEEGSVDILPSR
eukprot:CAMPEP_0204913664 /NCGR_PEP_ID=MMETSP1397-20131031/11509_1 /ASSEMBLY_ACC=CAM_ASM_000891 /TAXON_ID=49980 /ORGANISM="Climacostomum Climacostomum virens, Strain Stock W-24" /LENGTH=372 /DNA_ID=CAMNT_0052084947 /DNA_START=914 /DNA_END=2028 /DNA_ORIENTATION=-